MNAKGVLALMRLGVCCLMLSSFASLASAQAPSGTTTPVPSELQLATLQLATQTGNIKGRITLEDGSFVSEAVRVGLSNFRGTQGTIYTDNQGLFEFLSLPPGQYTLEAEGDRLLFEAGKDDVDVRRGATTAVTIVLRRKATGTNTKPRNAVASVTELANNVPARARKEFDRASALAREGKRLDAINHFRKAIEIYPNFMMAHSDLGGLLMEEGELAEALTEIQRAIQIDGKAFNPQLNLGIAYVRQQRFAEAAETLRKALALDSTSASARLYLGIALKELNEPDASERELRRAYELGGAGYSEALYHLGHLFMSKGERALARQALESYLQAVPKAANAAQARQLLETLR